MARKDAVDDYELLENRKPDIIIDEMETDYMVGDIVAHFIEHTFAEVKLGRNTIDANRIRKEAV